MKNKTLSKMFLVVFSAGSLFCATFWVCAPEAAKERIISELMKVNIAPASAQLTNTVIPTETQTSATQVITTPKTEPVINVVPDVTPKTTTAITTDATKVITTPTSNNADTSSGSNTTSSKTTYSLEAPYIISPKKGEVITGDKLIFEIHAKGANLVEFYYRQINAGTESTRYIKQGKFVGNDIWKLELLTASFPKGDYELIGKARMNVGGTLETSPMLFGVKKTVQTILQTDSSVTETETGIDPAQLLKESQAQSQQQLAERMRVAATLDQNADDDGDGVINSEELRLSTDPKVADTDGDGFLDGDEIRNGYNPLVASAGNKEDKILFQSPKEEGQISERYVVANVEVVTAGGDDSQMAGKKLLKMTGKALPNMFVTLYVYSESPIIVTVKTDNEGNWTYDLDKNLADGEHEVYVAVTDNTGKITGKSNPLRFIKTAEAATVIPSVQAQDRNISPVEKSKNTFVSMAIAIMAIFLSIALILIGVVTYKHQINEANN